MWINDHVRCSGSNGERGGNRDGNDARGNAKVNFHFFAHLENDTATTFSSKYVFKESDHFFFFAGNQKFLRKKTTRKCILH